MDEGLLSLKWNNHRKTFFSVLTSVRRKNTYNDVTLACGGKFYKAHKLILSTCSEYFEQMFEETQCKHPVVVLKDIKSEEMECLLDYMYIGEVNVVQDKLSGLIKAAECLRIKGLAVPDEEPTASKLISREKRTSDDSVGSEPKRQRQESSSCNISSNKLSDVNQRRKPNDSNRSKSNISGNNNPGSGSRNGHIEHSASFEIEQPQDIHIKAEVVDNLVMLDDISNDPVKPEPLDDDVYLSDSNSSAAEGKHSSYVDRQQRYMEELLGQNSASDQTQIGDFHGSEEGGGGHQLMVRKLPFQQSNESLISQRPIPSNDQVRKITESSNHIACFSTELSFTDQEYSRGAPLASSQFMAASAGQLDVPLDKSYVSFSAIAAARQAAQYGPSSSSKHLNSLPVTTAASFSSSTPQTASMSNVGEMTSLILFNDLNHEECLTPLKTFKCPVCNRDSIDKSSFRKHYTSHTGEKDFRCTICEYKTNQVSNLYRHCASKHQVYMDRTKKHSFV